MVSGNDYVIQVKGNQKKLKEAIVEKYEHESADERYFSEEKNKGRTEKREIHLFKNVKGTEFTKWSSIRDVIVIKRSGFRDGKGYEALHYYISSKSNMTAKEYGEVIRKHWYIENKLHWVKDVILYEDTCRIKDKSTAANHSMIRNMIINIYRLNGFQSLKKAIEKYTNRLYDCIDILNNIKYNINRTE